MELIFILYPPVQIFRIECINVRHHLYKVSFHRPIWFHEILNLAGKLLLCFAFFLLRDLCLLIHFLNLFFVLVPGQEGDDVL